MSSRSSTEQSVQVRPMLGGLETKLQPHMLKPEISPDLNNIVLDRGMVEKRGGFVPFIRQQPKANSVRNVGYRTRARENNISAAPNADFITVSGSMMAGHRPIYENLGDYTIEFFVRPEDLTDEHGGNASSAIISSGYAPAPYDLVIRPIISKGPFHRTEDTTGTLHGIVETLAGSPWGEAASGDAMPFCVYMLNTVSGWRFALSYHTRSGPGAAWQLQTVEHPIRIQEGSTYHLIASVSGSGAAALGGKLRIGELLEDQDISYVDQEELHPGQIPGSWNMGPIQVFDCPQDFVEATATGTATVRPGLDLGGAAQGGYWYAAKRFEGAVEDIAIWNTLTAADERDRIRKVDQDAAGSGLVSYWSFDRPGEGFIEERTGRGNHLFLAPAGPTADTVSGGVDGAVTWHFNGLTSYALVDLTSSTESLGNPNWRWYQGDGAVVNGCFQDYVVESRAHGMQVTFWVDALDRIYEQVIMEIHGVMRLALGGDGRLRVYVRSGDGASTTTRDAFGHNYQGPFYSTNTLVPGQRYHVSVQRRDGGEDIRLYIANSLESEFSCDASNTQADGARPIGGITFGMGSYDIPTRQAAATDVSSPQPVFVAMDSRSGFMGRIESGRVFLGEANREPRHGQESELDWDLPESQVWRHDQNGGSPMIVFPDDANDTVTNTDGAPGLAFGGDSVGGVQFVTPINTSAANPNLYQAPLTGLDYQVGGHDELDGVGARPINTLARWVFDVDDRDEQYAGSHVETEVYYPTTSPTDPITAIDPRGTHTQFSFVQDQRGYLGPIIKRSISPDRLYEVRVGTPNFLTRELTNRLTPYKFRSPRRLAPQWTEGMVFPLTGGNPITLIGDLKQEALNDRFTIIASGRQLYWAQPIWKRVQSPFADEGMIDVLRIGGQKRDRVEISSSNTEIALTAPNNTPGTPRTNAVVWEAWIYPLDLRGRRMLYSSAGTNFIIYLSEGTIAVIGAIDGGTKTWIFIEGQDLDPTGGLPGGSIKSKAWNHVHITLGVTGVVLRVNGDVVPMSDGSTNGSGFDGYLDGEPELISAQSYLGGPPPALEEVLYFISGTAQNRIKFESFKGYITNVRLLNDQDPLFLGLASGTPPMKRPVDGPNTYALYPFNERRKWTWRNQAALANPSGAESRVHELYVIKEGLEESSGSRYDWTVWRDQLFITNGESRPQRIRFLGSSDPRGPFEVTQLGIQPPVPVRPRFEPFGNTGPGLDGAYICFVTFFDATGRESEPVQCGTPVHPGGGPEIDGFRFINVPISDDPQVVGRNIYFSGNGGGDPIFNRAIFDNITREATIVIAQSFGTGTTQGNRLPAPRARTLAVASSSLLLGNLPGFDTGPNSIQVSQQSEPSYFRADLIVPIDSERGNPIIGLHTQLGRGYISKRDQVFSFSLQIGISTSLASFLANVSPVNTSIGVGGGVVVYDNVAFGGGDKGVHAFNGAGVEYASRSLEQEWLDIVDTSDEGLLNQFGAYLFPRGQYVLSFRRKGEQSNRTIYVGHIDLGGSWTRIEAPEHSFLERYLDPDDASPQLMIGTTSGALLRYEDEVSIDFHDGGTRIFGETRLQGSAIGGTQYSLEIAVSGDAFDTIASGFRGAVVEVTYLVGAVESVTTRVIESNSATELFWREPLPAGAVPQSYVIGGIDAYWTSPWLSIGPFGSSNKLEFLDVDFEARENNLDVSVTVARNIRPTDRLWDATNAELQEVDMTRGYLLDPLKFFQQQDGRWFRTRIGTKGINNPFGVIGMGYRVLRTGQRGVGGRQS